MNKSTKIGLVVALVVVAYALPILNLPFITTPQSDFPNVLFTTALYALVAVGLNVVTGYAGLLDLGYVGFYATGAYVMGIFTTNQPDIHHYGWAFLLVLPMAVIVTMLTGVLLGAPTLRVRGDYLAIVTMGFGELIRITIRNTDSIGGPGGIKQIPGPQGLGDKATGLFQLAHLKWDGLVPHADNAHKTKFLVFGVLDATPFYWLALTVLIIVVLLERLVKNGRVGRMWEATREDEDAAEIMGVPTFKFKLLAFATGATIGGLSGTLFAVKANYINPTSFPAALSMLFVAAVVIGGAGNRWGAMIGAVIVGYLPERFKEISVSDLILLSIIAVLAVGWSAWRNRAEPKWRSYIGALIGIAVAVVVLARIHQLHDDFSEWRQWFFGIALVLIVTFRSKGLVPAARSKAAEAAKKALAQQEKTEALAAGGATHV